MGPRAAVGNDCLLDQSSTIADTVIFAGSYVGQALELSHSIVDRNRLVSVKAATEIIVSDNFILGQFCGTRPAATRQESAFPNPGGRAAFADVAAAAAGVALVRADA